jgi:hypothetical protein
MTSRPTKTDRRKKAAAAVTQTPGCPEVDAILTNESLSTEAAGLQLHALAADHTRPLPNRLEALQHGLNLNIAIFGDLAEQPDLPTELASHLLVEMINYNESPATQLRTYLALIHHPDEEVATQAREMLAFQVGDDLHEETPDRLAQLGREKLQSLAKAAAQE